MEDNVLETFICLFKILIVYPATFHVLKAISYLIPPLMAKIIFLILKIHPTPWLQDLYRKLHPTDEIAREEAVNANLNIPSTWNCLLSQISVISTRISAFFDRLRLCISVGVSDPGEGGSDSGENLQPNAGLEERHQIPHLGSRGPVVVQHPVDMPTRKLRSGRIYDAGPAAALPNASQVSINEIHHRDIAVRPPKKKAFLDNWYGDSIRMEHEEQIPEDVRHCEATWKYIKAYLRASS